VQQNGVGTRHQNWNSLKKKAQLSGLAIIIIIIIIIIIHNRGDVQQLNDSVMNTVRWSQTERQKATAPAAHKPDKQPVLFLLCTHTDKYREIVVISRGVVM